MLQAHEQPYSEETCASIPQVRSDRYSHQDPILSRLNTSFRADIMMTLGWTGLRSLRPSLTQVGSGESYILRCFRITDFMRRGTNTGAMMGAAHVVTTSVGMCDVDLRCLFCVINLFIIALTLRLWRVELLMSQLWKYLWENTLNAWMGGIKYMIQISTQPSPLQACFVQQCGCDRRQHITPGSLSSYSTNLFNTLHINWSYDLLSERILMFRVSTTD